MTRFLCLCAVVLVCAVEVRSVRLQPDETLPDGEGKRILLASCTNCHDLVEVTKLRGFYTKEQWRDVVKTMIEYGAELKKGEDEVLAEYLTQHLGKKSR